MNELNLLATLVLIGGVSFILFAVVFGTYTHIRYKGDIEDFYRMMFYSHILGANTICEIPEYERSRLVIGWSGFTYLCIVIVAVIVF